ncbi:hypothetical protein KDE13_09315 [Campylobacter sp. faydin G-140]|uniref:hypothetical protein n=1 Tax=Campylobacter anatolicus TaxID=2829105 RepID=UPI001B912348|nr:hypothetical protein [Campylobacter anatolicus]MBR8466532.1 hypothetical protein [Campylobacter anatolicus]
MLRLLKKIYFLVCFSPIYLLGASGGNIASKIADAANTQIEEAGKSVASIVNTISIVFGVLWIVIMLIMAFFAIEQIKQHSKLIFGAIVIIGIVYGLSASMM